MIWPEQALTLAIRRRRRKNFKKAVALLGASVGSVVSLYR